MDWTDLVIKVDVAELDAAEAIAGMIVSRGLYIEDYSTLEDDLKLFGPVEIIDDELLAKDRSTAKIHVYVSPEENPREFRTFLEEKLAEANIKYTLEAGSVSEEDWANNWKKFFKSLLRLIPSWELENDRKSAEGKKALKDGRKEIVIDPGMAFGSGQHETTRLCLTLLEKYVTDGTSLLDVGTGSGILGIAGLLLGAKTATGVDIDALSVKIAGENAALNGVEKDFELIHGDLAARVRGRFSVITANIVADIIIRLLPDTERLLEDGGVIIVSGIIKSALTEPENKQSKTGDRKRTAKNGQPAS